MNFDFGSVKASHAFGSVTDPIALFGALSKGPGYGYLRAVQSAVLEKWYERRDSSDVVLKTNTGSGKTIVGLLALQSSIHDSKGPSLYLTPDKQLAEQVREEASKLGLKTTDDPRSTSFLSGEQICVTSIRTLFNGKSRFGLLGSADPVIVGTVVVDDAHTAVELVREASRLRFDAGHPAYDKLVNLFKDDLAAQSPNTFADIEDGDFGAVMKIPFWAWQSKQAEASTVLREYRNDDSAQWAWPFLAENLNLCEVVLSSRAVEISSPCPAIERLPSFADASRRIYLTATLSDESVLVTHFNADPAAIRAPILPDSASDLGDRLILAPTELNPGNNSDEVRELAHRVSTDHNTVVLVPSWNRARLWEDLADETVSKPAEIAEVVERLKSGHVGLVVIVNRYDGIDLPEEACRLLVLDELPTALSETERREAAALRDTPSMTTRQLQRLEQGMGRGVRSSEDRCAVLVVGSKATQLMARADLAERISAGTRAQIELSRQVSAELKGKSVGDLEGVIRQVIDGDEGFRELSRAALIDAKYSQSTQSSPAAHLRAAYNNAIAARNRAAAKEAAAAAEEARGSGDLKLAGWLSEIQSAYANLSNEVDAQQVLAIAREENPAVLRPIEGLEYQRIAVASDQATAATEFLSATYESGAAMFIGLRAVIAGIEWDEEATDLAEASLASLGEHLGFASQRPELTFGAGCDVLWALGPNEFAVIEAKTGATSALIWKKDINQLAGSIHWCLDTYGQETQVHAALVHPSNVVERSGTPPHGAVSIDERYLKRLKGAVFQFGKALADDDGYRDPERVEAQLQHFGLASGELFDKFSTPCVREPRKVKKGAM